MNAVPAKAAAEGIRVLAVDDDPVQLAMLRGLLSSRGHSVITASNTREALDLLQRDTPDLIITDLGLPDVTGDVLVQLCTTSYGENGPPVVVVSAQQEEATIRKALDAGARHYLHKPVVPSELAVVVEHAASRRRKRNAQQLHQVGPYRILKLLGAGGMGTVYLGEDSQGGRAAIKLLRADVSGPEPQQRMRREVDLLFMMRHPAIVRLLSTGRHGDQVYLAMEYVPGATLHDAMVQGGPLRPSLALGVARRLLPALAYLQESGVVHRDINPRNIIMAADGARLIDFGISRPAMDNTLTREGFVMGTVVYLAPELLRGAMHSTASDVFALGLTLAESILGQHPLLYPADDLVARCSALEAGRHLDAVRTLDMGPLRNAIESMLAPRPERRPTPAAMAAMLAP